MTRPPLDDKNGYFKSEQSLDLFSHDSTHVRLVVEAEKQSSIARFNAMDILQKYSKDIADENEAENENFPDDERDEKQDPIDSYASSPYTDCRNQYTVDHKIGNEGNSSDDESDARPQNDVFDEKFGQLSEQDIQHMARCLLPLSPKGLRKNKAKQVSGRFEFKRINSGSLSVVKSHAKLVIKPKDESQAETEPVKKRKKRGLRRRLSFSSRSRASRDMDSGVHTDDAYLKTPEVKISRKEDGLQSPNNAAQSQLNKEVKEGDLPPKPTLKKKSKRKMSLGAPSSRATASDVDLEEIISVVSSMSELSELSISEKAKERGPVVLTEAMLKTPIIPDTICLKKTVKLTKMEVLKRKLSFSKGRI